MSFKYAGGKFLDPHYLLENINNLHNRHSAAFSSKIIMARDILLEEMGVMGFAPTNNKISILIENIQVVTEDFAGNLVSDMSGPRSFGTSNMIPSGIVNATLTEVDGVPIPGTSIVGNVNNISTPIQVKLDRFDNVECNVFYYYTYQLLTISIPSSLPENVYYLQDFRNSSNAVVNLANLSTIRLGYNLSDDVRIGPILINNYQIGQNVSTIIADSFLNTNIIAMPAFTVDNKKTPMDYLEFKNDMFREYNRELLKLTIISTNTTTLVQAVGGVELVSKTTRLIKTGYYIHEYIIDLNFGTYTGQDYTAKIRFINASFIQAMCINLRKMNYEYSTNSSSPKTLPVMADTQPLSNIYLNAVDFSSRTYKEEEARKEWTLTTTQKQFRDADTDTLIYETTGIFEFERKDFTDRVYELIGAWTYTVEPVQRGYVALNNKLEEIKATYNGELENNQLGLSWATEFLN